MSRIAVLQMNTGIDAGENAQALADSVGRAAGEGANMLFTPEMSGLLDRDRKRAASSIRREDETEALAKVRDSAARAGVWVALGSLAVRTEEGRWANRSFVI